MTKWLGVNRPWKRIQLKVPGEGTWIAEHAHINV